MRKVDFRNLADPLSKDTSFVDPELQREHAAMKELADLLYFNLMNQDEQGVYGDFINQEGLISGKVAFDVMGKNGGDHHSLADVEETLYSGLMSDAEYYIYELEKKDNPKITARQYFELYVLPHADRNIKKLASSFVVILKDDSPTSNKQQTVFISKAELEANKEDKKWVSDNYDAIINSQKHW